MLSPINTIINPPPRPLILVKPECGIYSIINIVNGKCYIGSAVNWWNRCMHGHLSKLRRNKHPNPHLQSAWNEYGEDSFVFGLMEFCKPSQLLIREQYWLDQSGCCDPRRGYNILTSSTGGPRGRKMPAEQKQKISVSLKGRRWSEDRKAKLKGISRSVETRQKVSLAKMGHLTSDETRRRISKGNRKSSSPWKNLPWPHGAKCRCDKCKKVRAKYEKERIKRKRRESRG